MTDIQKEQIIEFRQRGFGYKKIGQQTGLSENTVKTFCRRNGLGGIAAREGQTPPDETCPCCGKPVVTLAGRKPKRFCSDRCRNKWWNSHLDLVNRKANYEFVCQCCGKPFTAYGNPNRKYCSHECYIEDRFWGGGHE